MKAEDIAKVNEGLKTIDVKNKQYVQVNERIKAFRAICPNGTIKTDIIEYNEESITMMTSVLDETGKLLATGYAREEKKASNVNRTSYVENCETSATGRALGFCGIGVDGSVASAEEVANAIMNQTPKADAPKPVPVDADIRANIADDLKTKISKEQVAQLLERCKADGVDVKIVTDTLSVKSLEELTVYQFKAVKQNWSKLKAKAKK